MPNSEPPLESFSSIHTDNFPSILRQFGMSVLVTTYQAGRLVILRPEKKNLNTHFIAHNKPMGMCGTTDQLYLGTKNEVFEYRNVPGVIKRLEQTGLHDACLVPRNRHMTGNIDIHEMAVDANNDLLYLNTRFSCLCKLESDHNFNPIWKPNFITGYATEDRCHLNGLGLKDGKPKYFTALGQTNSPQGWRDNKRNGGILMDIDQNIIATQLSMPHSPRWHNNKLWVLESGQGDLSQVDVSTGKLTTVARLPGFTRGIEFFGNYALVGLSQIRESATFSELPITERIDKRVCGVYLVDLITGNTLAFVEFQGAAQEIFAVQLLKNTCYPTILDYDDPLLDNTYVIPTEALKLAGK